MKGLRIPALRHRHLQTASQSPRSIAGSAPSYRGHLILESNLPASQWPSKVESLYPVLPALQNLAQDTSSPLYNFGFALSPGRSSDSAGLNGASLCLPDQQRVMQPQENIDFSKPVDEVVSELQAWIQRAPLINSSPSADLAPLHVFVCTHAARDCRCGTLGTSFLHGKFYPHCCMCILAQFIVLVSMVSRTSISCKQTIAEHPEKVVH